MPSTNLNDANPILSGIYIIINPKAKVYVGQTVDLKNRKKYYERLDCKGQKKLYSSLKKYGWNQHYFSIMEYCSVNELNIRERFWQDEYEAIGEYGLNLKLTETSDRSGFLAEEVKKKMSESAKKSWTEERKEKQSKKLKGRIVSTDTRSKISQSLIGKPSAFKGKQHSDESKKNMSKGQKGKIPWNKGQKNIYSDEVLKKMSDAKKGITAWNKGIPRSEEVKRKISETKKMKSQTYIK